MSDIASFDPAVNTHDSEDLMRRCPSKWHSWCAMCVSCVSLVLVGCSSEETTVSYQNPIEAELLDDTAPEPTPYDELLSYVDRGGRTSNHSTDRYRFDVAAYHDEAEQQQAETLYASHGAFLSEDYASIPSVQTIGTYLKQVDDTIYAGVEQAVQDGIAPTVAPKREILTGALGYLADHRSSVADAAIVHVGAALELGGAQAEVPADLVSQVDALQEEFLASTIESKPIGFYTWSEGLQQIWQQDRLLQRELSPSTACALAEALAADPDRRARYEQLLGLYQRMTNPLHSSLAERLDIATEPSCGQLDSAAFLSSSETPEVELFNTLYPAGVPADADLMGDLVQAIRDGSIDLAPQPEDGWYQHQLYALETLLVTDRSEERAKIAFMARYKKRLQEAFQTMLVQHRETHVKQADTMNESAAVYMPKLPNFRVEPLATVYVRHARSYVFLEVALDTVLGASFLDEAPAVGADGPLDATLRERIHAARDLFFGLYIVSCQDIGLLWQLDSIGDPEPEQIAALAAAADQWLLELADDPVAQSDVRVMVPIAMLPSGRAKYWAVIGVRATITGYSFIEGMDVSPPPPEDQARIWLPTEQFLEVESSRTPLNRDEFRALCDEQGSAAGIQAALEAR